MPGSQVALDIPAEVVERPQHGGHVAQRGARARPLGHRLCRLALEVEDDEPPRVRALHLADVEVAVHPLERHRPGGRLERGQLGQDPGPVVPQLGGHVGRHDLEHVLELGLGPCAPFVQIGRGGHAGAVRRKRGVQAGALGTEPGDVGHVAGDDRVGAPRPSVLARHVLLHERDGVVAPIQGSGERGYAVEPGLLGEVAAELDLRVHAGPDAPVELHDQLLADD